MVPIRDAQGKSVPLPANPLNEFGYGLEFDAGGRSGELSIDFDAIAAHLQALEREARKRGATLRRVILAPEYQKHVTVGPEIPFMKGKPWIRHDEHYHVDFAIRCEPL